MSFWARVWSRSSQARIFTKVIVCNPRKNALMNAGRKSDRFDARKLSDLLPAGMLTPVSHGENAGEQD